MIKGWDILILINTEKIMNIEDYIEDAIKFFKTKNKFDKLNFSL